MACTPCGEAIMTLGPVEECSTAEGPNLNAVTTPTCKPLFCGMVLSCPADPDASPIPALPLAEYKGIITNVIAQDPCSGIDTTLPHVATEAPSTTDVPGDAQDTTAAPSDPQGTTVGAEQDSSGTTNFPANPTPAPPTPAPPTPAPPT